jgi:type I restriction enzyme, S subunit
MKPGYKQTEVGVLPKEWDVALMDSVAKRGSGHTPDKQHPEYWDGSIKWISLKDSDRLDNLYIADTAATITPAGIANSSAVMHRAGTVVLSRDAGVGKSSIMKDEMAVSQHFIAWLCGPRLNNHFLYYWLQAKKSEFERIAFGNTIKTIGLSYFKKLKIPLPLLHEQQMVAAALVTVDALISELDQLITKKRALKQAAMQQLLTGKSRLPGFSGDWEVKRLGEIATFFSGGTPSTVVPEYYNGEIQWITSGDLNKGQILEVEGRISQQGLKNSSAKMIEADTLLLALYGATSGVTAMSKINAAINQAVLAIVPFHDSKAFLYYKLAYLKDLLINTYTQGGQPNLSGKLIKSIEFEIPTYEEQCAIASVLSDMDAEITALERRRDKTRAIKQGMMQDLLTGKIRLI